jgi:hypothetical protein
MTGVCGKVADLLLAFTQGAAALLYFCFGSAAFLS